MIDLRKASVKKGTRDNGQRYYEISERSNTPGQPANDVVKLCLKDDEEYELWGKVFLESINSDQHIMRHR
jgi:hypothetical protein